MDYRGKKILILGMAREGVDSLRYFLKHHPSLEIAAADRLEPQKLGESARELLKNNSQIRYFYGDGYLSAIDDYDLVVKSPGVPIHLPEIEAAFKKNKITSQSEIFFNECPGKIIGITGTKGKSTTASIIYAILRRAGKRTFLLGNIGEPMLSYLDVGKKETIFVCELSAHQLYNLKQSPALAVLLNIYPEHLDYYNNYNEYILAKANIALHQSKNDYFIYNSDIPEVNAIAIRSLAQKIAFNEYDWNFFGKTELIGEFNMQNAKIGAIIGRLFGVSDEIINGAIENFKPLDNRLEFIGNFAGIDCYNDSLSTIQESAVAAISALGERVKILIAGGFDRGQPFDKLAVAILSGSIETLILFLPTGDRIWREIENQAVILGKKERLSELKHYFVKTMEEAVDLVFKNGENGSICLLSAASASFGGFADYADRGRRFKECLIIRAN